MQTWLAITATMGGIFLVGQLYEYTHLEFGLTTNLFASAFYVLTGFHGLHVLSGFQRLLPYCGDRALRVTTIAKNISA
jgi:cytochrome c oxidase subunit 3